MLRDTINNSTPDPNCITAIGSQESATILSFVDEYISGFRNYYESQSYPHMENRISDLLVQYLQCCKQKYSDGFILYDFRKNPTQSDNAKETDIGVYILSLNISPMLPFFEFEAKRLSNTKHNRPNNKEYVFGQRGGMERFKRCEHSPHVNEAGMFGYIQSDSAEYWKDRINEWINEVSDSGADIDWSNPNESLLTIDRFKKVIKLKSENMRINSDTIYLWHYMIDLV